MRPLVLVHLFQMEKRFGYCLIVEVQYSTCPIGTAIRGFSSGRPRGTTPADDRYIVLQARRNRRQTAGEIARHTTQATGRPISRFTVARRLHGGGLFARRSVRCVPLTPAHRRRRSLWCWEHQNWRDNEWGRVLFTDESRFSLSSDSHRILIWRERGSRNRPSNIIERDRYGGRSVLVWGGIMLGSRTDLHIFDAGSVNGTLYCNEILLPYVRLFRGARGLQFLFMDDNAPCHRTVAAEQLLESRRLAARTLPPVTIQELRLALQDEWAAMPQQLIDTLILSMGRRWETCSSQGRSYPLLKTVCFLLDTHRRDVSAFSCIALHATFSIKLLFIPLISLLVPWSKQSGSFSEELWNSRSHQSEKDTSSKLSFEGLSKSKKKPLPIIDPKNGKNILDGICENSTTSQESIISEETDQDCETKRESLNAGINELLVNNEECNFIDMNNENEKIVPSVIPEDNFPCSSQPLEDEVQNVTVNDKNYKEALKDERVFSAKINGS
ncbi:transposable element Tc3 transposase [Trichonephila clavipes]|nr:transposable element Tc3 transposase [Trichonephila clavipes]